MLKQVLLGAVMGCVAMGAAAQAGSVAIVSAELKGQIDTKKAKVGDPVTVSLRKKSKLSSGLTLPVGTTLTGHITAVTVQAKGTDGVLALVFDTLKMNGNEPMKIEATLRGIGPSLGEGEDDDGEVKLGSGMSMGGSGDVVGGTGAERGTANLGNSGTTTKTTSGGAGSKIKGVTLVTGDATTVSGTMTGKDKNVKLEEGAVLTMVVVTK